MILYSIRILKIINWEVFEKGGCPKSDTALNRILRTDTPVY